LAMRMQVDPTKISVNPLGEVVIDDEAVLMQVGAAAEPLATNSSSCNGINTVCNNTGDCSTSSNESACSNASHCSTITPPS